MPKKKKILLRIGQHNFSSPHANPTNKFVVGLLEIVRQLSKFVGLYFSKMTTLECCDSIKSSTKVCKDFFFLKA